MYQPLFARNCLTHIVGLVCSMFMCCFTPFPPLRLMAELNLSGVVSSSNSYSDDEQLRPQASLVFNAQRGMPESWRGRRSSLVHTSPKDVLGMWVDVLRTYCCLSEDDVQDVANKAAHSGLPPPSKDASSYLSHDMLKELGIEQVGVRCKVMLACERMPRYYKFVPHDSKPRTTRPEPSSAQSAGSTGGVARGDAYRVGIAPNVYSKDPNTVSLRTMSVSGGVTWYDLIGRDKRPEDPSLETSKFFAAYTELCMLCEAGRTDGLIQDALSRSLPLPQMIQHDDRPHECVIILRQCSLPAEADADDISSLTHQWTIYIDTFNNIVATIHRIDSKELSDLRTSFSHQAHGLDAAGFLFLLLEKSVKMYRASVVESEALLDVLESRMLSKTSDNDNTLRSLFHLQRRGSVYDRLMGITQTFLLEDLGPFLGSIEDVEVVVTGEFGPTRGDMADLLARSRGLLDIHLSLVGFRTNELMKHLTKVSMLFTPLSFIVGFFGMNFQNMPELAYENSYYICIAGLVLVSILMMCWFRYQGL